MEWIDDRSFACRADRDTIPLEKADRLFQNGQVEEGIEVLWRESDRFPEVDCIYVTLLKN